MFQLFRNKLKQGFGKVWNTRPQLWRFETLQQWDYIGKLLKRTEIKWKLTKSLNVSVVRNVMQQTETRNWKRWKYQAPLSSGVLKHCSTWDYIGKLMKWTETWRKLLKWTETWCKLTKSERFICFETFHINLKNKVLEKWPISGVLKHCNIEMI